jgi:hypothetical protein
MNDWLKKYLLSTAMRFDPREPAGGPDGDDRIPEPDLDDDETVTDPVDEDADPADDADADPEADDDVDPQPDPAASARPASRGDRTIGELRRLARERAEENAQLTRRLAELEGRVASQSQPAAETAAQRAERLALLSPEERAMEMVNEALERNNRQQQQFTAQLMDQSDRSAFEARAAVNPLFKKLSSAVERELASLRAKGQSLPRETIAVYLIGQRVVAQQAEKPRGGTTRRQREQARPARPGGDAPAARGARRGNPATAEDYEAQFGDVSI